VAERPLITVTELAGRRGDPGEHRGQHLRLDRKEEHARQFGHLGVAGHHPRAGFLAKGRAGGGAWVTAKDLPGRNETCANETPGQGCGHLAGAEKCDRQLRRHGGFITGRQQWRK